MPVRPVVFKPATPAVKPAPKSAIPAVKPAPKSATPAVKPTPKSATPAAKPVSKDGDSGFGPLITITNQAAPVPWRYAISASTRNQNYNNDTSPSINTSTGNSNSNSSLKYVLDGNSRPLLIEKTTQRTSSYTDSSSGSNSNSPYLSNEVSYYSFYYGSNSVLLAKFTKFNDQDKLYLESIQSLKYEPSAKSLLAETIWFNESSKLNGLIAPSSGSINQGLTASNAGATRLTENYFPDGYEFDGSNYALATKSNQQEITLKPTSSRDSVQFTVSSTGDGEKVNISGTSTYSNGLIRSSGTAKGDPKYTRTDGSYLLDSNFALEMKPYSGSFENYTKWMINDAVISGGLTFLGPAALLGGIMGVNPLALRVTAITDTSRRSNNNTSNSSERANIDSLTGYFNGSTSNYEYKNAGYLDPTDAQLHAGTYRSNGDSSTVYTDQAGLSAGYLMPSGSGESLRAQLDGMVRNADNIGERFELSSWGGSNRFLYTTLL